MTRLHVGAGALLLTSYGDHSFDSLLTTEQCNAFLELCKAEIVNQCNTKDALAAVFTLLKHMESTCQPPANLATYVLVTQSLAEQVQYGILSDQVLLQLYVEILPQMHKALGTSKETSAVYAAAIAAFMSASRTKEAFLVFLLMFQNHVEGLTPDCCDQILDMLTADQSTAMWDYANKQFGEAFLEALAVGGSHTGVTLPLHSSVPRLTVQTTADGMKQKVSVEGPALPWVNSQWQEDFSYTAAEYEMHTGTSDGIDACQASDATDTAVMNQRGKVLADGDVRLLKADPDAALQHLLAMPKARVRLHINLHEHL
jgi:hypothetical protein